MDPYLESQVWEDFHHDLAAVIRERLTPQVRPRYIVRVEKRVYLEHVVDDESRGFRPDIGLLQAQEQRVLPERAGDTTMSFSPVLLSVPVPEEIREAFITVRDGATMELVTVIEILSPTNKRPGCDGRREYLTKRETVLRSATHLVELDLLRGGERLPTVERLPPGDYYAFVCRGRRRPRAEVYPWALSHRLPVIPIPLAGKDPDVHLDLQEAFNTVYERAGYDYSVDYRAPAAPALSGADRAWAEELIATWRRNLSSA
jgi:hypothetical protein